MNVTKERVEEALSLIRRDAHAACVLWLQTYDLLCLSLKGNEVYEGMDLRSTIKTIKRLEAEQEKTNQGGGGDAAGTASPQVRTDSAAAASFEERVRKVVDVTAGDVYWLAARYIEVDNANAAKDEEIKRLSELLTKAHALTQEAVAERDKACRERLNWSDETGCSFIDLRKVLEEVGTKPFETATGGLNRIRVAIKCIREIAAARDALKAKLDVAEKECDKARLVLGAYDSLDGGYGSRTWIQFHDARRAAEGKS